MYKLIAELNEQTDSTLYFFDESDAKRRLKQYTDGGYKAELFKVSIAEEVKWLAASGMDDFEVWCALANGIEDYAELERKANAYDAMIEARRRGAAKANAISPEERTARAKKAAAKRWNS